MLKIIKTRIKFVRFNTHFTHSHEEEQGNESLSDKTTREELVIFRESTNLNFEKTLSRINSLERTMENMMNCAKEDRADFLKEIRELQMLSKSLALFVILVISVILVLQVLFK
jgi:hypothetical protein